MLEMGDSENNQDDIQDNVRYLPGAKESILADKVIRIAQAIKRDIGRFLRYQEQSHENPKTIELQGRCKDRILIRLESIVKLQSKSEKDNIAWKGVLRKALTKVYKHRSSEEFQDKLHKLFKEYELDNTSRKVHFLRAYMEIVGKVPAEKSSIPFHG